MPRRNSRALAMIVGSLALAGLPALAAKKTASFTVTAVHSGPGLQVTITSRVWVTPTQARAEVRHPIDGEVIYLVSNGYLYQLDPASKRGIKGPLPPEMRKSKDNFELLVSKFAFDASGPLKGSKKLRTETVSGFQCDVHSNSVTQGGATRTITVWVPQRMEPRFPIKAVLRDRLSKPGATVDQSVDVTLSNIRLNEPIPASLFQVPPGYKIISGTPTPPRATRRRK